MAKFVYPAALAGQANFLTCVRTLVKSGLPPDYRLVFPPADEQEILGILRGEAGVEVLTAVGSMKLTKDWHRQAANVGGLAASVQCSSKLCKESLKAVGQRGQFMKGVAQGIGGLAASLILGKLVQNGLEACLNIVAAGASLVRVSCASLKCDIPERLKLNMFADVALHLLYWRLGS